MLWVEPFAGLFGFKVVLVIGLVVAHEQRPAEVPGLPCLVDLVVSARAARRPVFPGVRPDLAPVQVAVALIDCNLERVAVAHDVDFGPRLFLTRLEEIAFGNRVAAIGLGMNAQDFAAQVVGIAS